PRLGLGRAGRGGPPAAPLPRRAARLAQPLPQGVGRDARQAVGGFAQGLLQGAERPGGGAVLLGRRDAPGLAQDAVTGLLAVDAGAAAAGPRDDGSSARVVEAGDPGGGGGAALAPGGAGG